MAVCRGIIPVRPDTGRCQGNCARRPNGRQDHNGHRRGVGHGAEDGQDNGPGYRHSGCRKPARPEASGEGSGCCLPSRMRTAPLGSSLLNDGAILSIAYDTVLSSNQSEVWNMRVVVGIDAELSVAGPLTILQTRTRGSFWSIRTARILRIAADRAAKRRGRMSIGTTRPTVSASLAA